VMPVTKTAVTASLERFRKRHRKRLHQRPAPYERHDLSRDGTLRRQLFGSIAALWMIAPCPFAETGSTDGVRIIPRGDARVESAAGHPGTQLQSYSVQPNAQRRTLRLPRTAEAICG